MAYVTQSRLVFCYDNAITPDNVTGVTLTNITADGNFPAENLKYADPKLKLMTRGTSGSDRVIQFDLASPSVAFACLGVCAHNLISRGYETVKVEYSSDGTSWTNVGTATVSLLDFTGVTGQDCNFFVRFGAVGGPTHWRVTFGMASASDTRAAFEIGMIFLGPIYEVAKNATDGAIFTTIEVPMEFSESLGGDKWLAPGPAKYREELEVSFSRLTHIDYKTIAWKIGERNARKIVGVIPPELVQNQMPSGNQHFFGYLDRPVSNARSGFASTNHRYDLTLHLTGAT
jgi:hypothetical protein